MDGPGPNPGLLGEKLTTNCLSYGTAFDIMLVIPGHYDISLEAVDFRLSCYVTFGTW